MDHRRLEAAARNFGRDMLIGPTWLGGSEPRNCPEQGVITVRHGLTKSLTSPTTE